MMKVSDPIIFGHAVSVFLQDCVREAWRGARRGRREPEQRPGRPAGQVASHAERSAAIKADIAAMLAARAAGHGGFRQGHHQPACAQRRDHRCLDARAIRARGKMWGPDGKLHDMDRDDPGPLLCRDLPGGDRRLPQTGALDVRTMGNVSNIGLMAQAAEEYGSHPTRPSRSPPPASCGSCGQWRRTHRAQGGRGRHLAHVPDPRTPIDDWVKLAIDRAAAPRLPAIFWLDSTRAHDRELIAYVEADPQPRHQGARTIPHPRPARGHAAVAGDASARARTPSPSPAMCCAIT